MKEIFGHRVDLASDGEQLQTSGTKSLYILRSKTTMAWLFH
jgi:hypothetical protein